MADTPVCHHNLTATPFLLSLIHIFCFFQCDRFCCDLIRDVYWAKYNGDSPDDPDNPDNPDDPVTKKYTIKYVLYDGENSDANPSSYKITTETITLKKAKKKGYTFEGWYKESSFKNRITTIPKGSKGNLTIYAKWKANKYKMCIRDRSHRP